MKILYLPDKGKNVHDWGGDIMFNSLTKHVSNGINMNPCFNLDEAITQNVDVIFLHNIGDTALMRKKIKGSAKIEQTLDRRFPMFHKSKIKEYSELKDRPLLIGGIRGFYGLQKCKPWIKYFDAVHTSNDWLTDQCRKAGALRPYTLHCGVDTEKFTPMRELRPINHGLNFVIGWAGDITKPCKNFHLLQKFGFQYSIATKENFKPHSEMPGFYNSVSAYVYMSDHEGCNRTILEASACGLPVVTSDAGTVRKFIDSEWIIKGNPKSRNYMKKTREKLIHLALYPKLRDHVGDLNRENVLKFGWPRIAERFECVIRFLLSGDQY